MKPSALLIAITLLGVAAALSIRQRNLAVVTRVEIAQVTAQSSSAQDTLRDKEQQIATAREFAKSVQAEVAALARPVEVIQSWKSVPLGEADWGTDNSFIDIPKKILKSLRVPGLSFESELAGNRGREIELTGLTADAHATLDAAVFLGMTASERATVRDAYFELNHRFEQLQQARLTRTNDPVAQAAQQPGEKITFVIPPMPDEQVALKQEWDQILEQSLGPSRASIFSTYSTNASSGLPRSIGVSNSLISALASRPLADWLKVATNETRITAVFTPAQPNGDRVTRPRTNFYYSTGTGSGSGPQNRWPNLLTPEVLAARP